MQRRICGRLMVIAGMLFGAPLSAQEARTVVDLTLDRMVDLALGNSYRVRQLNLGIGRTQQRLRAERARLKSRVDLSVSAPEFESISETKWNSDLQKNEIIHENTRRWEAQLSVRQPVVLLGYPTNGYLSLNNRMYRYLQIEEDGDRDLRYYNRYFVRYTQPLFQPNGLKNDLEEAELDLEDAELDFLDDVVGIVDDLSDDYFELFEDAYGRVINEGHVANLVVAVAGAEEAARADSSQANQLGQIRVELANAREQLLQSESQFRLQAASLRTRLSLSDGDSIALNPVLDVRPVPIDVGQATRFAMELNPRLRQLGITYRENEINLDQTKGRNSFRVNLEFSYGREMQNPAFQEIWSEPTNTYSVDVNAYIPILDWGERRARVQVSELGMRQTELRIEEATADIVSDVENEIRNVEEFQNRALAMQENLTLAAGLSASSLELFQEGSITALDLLLSFRRELDTANNLLDAYLGWRRALLRLQELTYFDFENGTTVLDRFDMTIPGTR